MFCRGLLHGCQGIDKTRYTTIRPPPLQLTSEEEAVRDLLGNDDRWIAMQTDSLEGYEREFPNEFRRAVQSLNQHDRWRSVVAWLRRHQIEFSEFQTQEMERSRSPSTNLMAELKARCCPVKILKTILRETDLLETLSIISELEPLTIVVQPSGNPGCTQHHELDVKCQHIPWGAELELTCTATGLPRPSYQWFCDNVPALNGTDCQLKIPTFTLSHEGDYYCVVSHCVGESKDFATSDVVVCKLMHSLPAFAVNLPASVVCELKSSLTLKVAIKCTSPFALQWYKGNTELENENSETLVRHDVSSADSGVYRCSAHNEAGQIWSFASNVQVEACKSTPPPTSKLALLIGNSQYDNFGDLMTPGNDIILLAGKLKKLDFEVIPLINLTSQEMNKVIERFFELVSPGSYVVFCFIGHGFKYHARNYMMPVDCESFDDGPNVLNSVICDELLVQKANSSKLGLLLLIVDMCLKELDSSPKNEKQEQYVYEPHSSCHVVKLYSTGPNQRAYEISGQYNGIYVRHISKYIFEDQPIVQLALKANEKFCQSPISDFQIPYFTVHGGLFIRLTTPAKEQDVHINQLHCIRVVHIKFSMLDSVINFTVIPRGGHLANAVDIKYPQCPPSWSFDCKVPQAFESGVPPSTQGHTICNLQRAKDTIKVHIRLKIKCNNDIAREDTAILDLAVPYIAELLKSSNSEK